MVTLSSSLAGNLRIRATFYRTYTTIWIIQVGGFSDAHFTAAAKLPCNLIALSIIDLWHLIPVVIVGSMPLLALDLRPLVSVFIRKWRFRF